MWKVVAKILNFWLAASIACHDFLHILRTGRGTGTATFEDKLLHQLAALRKEVLYVIFMYLHKAYDALESYRCLEIMEGYGVGSRAYHLLCIYLGRLRMVAKAGGGGTTGLNSRASGSDSVRPAVPHHLQCGGQCSGETLG